MNLIQLTLLIVSLQFVELRITSNKASIDLGNKMFYDLQCSLTTNSNLKPKWFKNGQMILGDDSKFKVIESNNTLQLINIRRADHEGDYVCQIQDSDQLWNLTFKVRSKPDIVGIQSKTHSRDVESVSLLEGEDLELICEVNIRNNKNDNISFTWYRTFENGGTQILDPPTFIKSDNYRDLDQAYASFVHSILKKEKIGFEDRAMYTCEVSNGISKSDHTVMVRVKDKLGALWPFLGIVGEVVILCTIIVIYEKRRNKPEVEESEDNSGSTKSESHPKMTR